MGFKKKKKKKHMALVFFSPKYDILQTPDFSVLSPEVATEMHFKNIQTGFEIG